MSKKMKIAYYATMAVFVSLSIYLAIIGHYEFMITSDVSLAWLALCYHLSSVIAEQEKAIDTLIETLDKTHGQLERAKGDVTALTLRAEKAEAKYQALVDDTPARGKDGRFTKREE